MYVLNALVDMHKGKKYYLAATCWNDSCGTLVPSLFLLNAMHKQPIIIRINLWMEQSEIRNSSTYRSTASAQNCTPSFQKANRKTPNSTQRTSTPALDLSDILIYTLPVLIPESQRGSSSLDRSQSRSLIIEFLAGRKLLCQDCTMRARSLAQPRIPIQKRHSFMAFSSSVENELST